MKKNIFAICDPEAGYVRCLAEYISCRNNIPFEIHSFTGTEALLSFAAEHRIELLLISPAAMNGSVRELDVGRLVILSESCDKAPGKDYPTVYKYQSSAQLLKETMAAYNEAGNVPDLFPVLKKSTAVYGVYSPIGGCGKTILALALAQELARRIPVLLLNLEGCSGLAPVMDGSAGHSLSDLLYYSRQKDQNLNHRMSAMIQTVGGADLIPPVRLAEDIHQAAWEDLSFLIQEILTKSTYEALVIDIGNEICDILPLLELCDRIVMPVKESGIAAFKVQQFESSLRLLEMNSLLDRITRTSSPEPPAAHLTAFRPEELLWGPVGDQVRELLALFLPGTPASSHL